MKLDWAHVNLERAIEKKVLGSNPQDIRLDSTDKEEAPGRGQLLQKPRQ